MLQTAAHLIESPKPALFYFSGLVAYVLAQLAWDSIELKFSDLPTALVFLKALTILSTGYWACLPFATLTYRIAKKMGVLVGVLMLAIFLAVNKVSHLGSDGSVLGDALRAVSLISVGGGIVGCLIALHYKFNPEEEKR